MPQVRDRCGTLCECYSAVLLARIVDNAGENVTSADIESILYSIEALDPCRPDRWVVVDGHDEIELAVDDVVFDGLQTGRPWTIDDVGYNFRHELDISTSEPFPKAGVQYRVRYEFMTTMAQRAIVRFQLRMI